MRNKEYFRVGYMDPTNPEGVTLLNKSQFNAIQERDFLRAMELGVPFERYLQLLTVIY